MPATVYSAILILLLFCFLLATLLKNGALSKSPLGDNVYCPTQPFTQGTLKKFKRNNFQTIELKVELKKNGTVMFYQETSVILTTKPRCLINNLPTAVQIGREDGLPHNFVLAHTP